MNSHRYVLLLRLSIQVVLGAAFLVAAVLKAFDPAAGEGGINHFARLIAVQGVIPSNLSYLAAAGVLGVECLLAFVLILSRSPRLAVWGSMFVLTLFSLYLVRVATAKGFVECNCFGSLGPSALKTSLARNSLLAALAGIWLILDRRLLLPAVVPGPCRSYA